MQNEIQVFSFEGAELRTVVIDGEPWLCGKDVAERLGYERGGKAILDHVDADDRRIIQKSYFGTLENPLEWALEDIPNRGMTFINESGFYSLVLGSKLPDAKRIKKWVTSEVLPTLRKQGSYTMPNHEQSQKMTAEELDIRRKELEVRRGEMLLKAAELAPRNDKNKYLVEFDRSILEKPDNDDERFYHIVEIAKDCGCFYHDVMHTAERLCLYWNRDFGKRRAMLHWTYGDEDDGGDIRYGWLFNSIGREILVNALKKEKH